MKLVDMMNMLMIKAMLKINAFFDDERGDTNFISILVLLGIALALAAVFLGSIVCWHVFWSDQATGRGQPHQ